MWVTKQAVELLTGRSRRSVDRDCEKSQWRRCKFKRQRAEFFSLSDIEKTYGEAFSSEKLARVEMRLKQFAVRSD